MPDPRSRRGRWYSLTAILLVCACAAVSGARSIDELAEWGECAPDALMVIGIRRHPEVPHLRAADVRPPPKSVDDVLRQVCGKVLDQFGIENETFSRWTG